MDSSAFLVNKDRMVSGIKIDINKHEFNIIWDGTYYKALSEYPKVSPWEMKCIVDFIEYEKSHGRDTEIISENEEIMERIRWAVENKTEFEIVAPPERITECTACLEKGCITKFLCHTASVENGISILKDGRILSAVKVRNISSEELAKEKRNAAGDPEDFFYHLMLSWGNCQAGDRLVMERKLGRMPQEEDLSSNFTPGIRFYFSYEDMKKHKGAVSDGYHALKIRDELLLKENVLAVIVPEYARVQVENEVSEELKDRIHYIDSSGMDIWEWSSKVYEYINNL